MKTLFLQPPSFKGFDGGAGSRYQARREIKSFWFPTWLAQAATLIPDSKLIDATPANLSAETVIQAAKPYRLVIIHTSVPSFANDAKFAEALKKTYPSQVIGFVGPRVSIQPTESLKACQAIDFVARGEFDLTVKDIAEGKKFTDVLGISYRDPLTGEIIYNEDRPLLADLDQLGFTTEIYHRDLKIEDYFIGYLKHPYMSFYTGRGCKSHCTFCLWPQTIGGHLYRVRSVEAVVKELHMAKKLFPQVKEFFFDDDTFTDNLPRAEEIARGLGKMGMVWSCNAKANVPRSTLEVFKENGLRLLLVGYESGNQQILHNIRKGLRLETAERFTKDCHELGIKIHGTFILGLPGETKETIQETIRYAIKLNPHTLQVSLAAPYPGTELYQKASENNWFAAADISELVNGHGLQMAPLQYPHLSHTEIFNGVDEFYKRFYFRAPKIASILSEMITSPQMLIRRLREGVEFFSFLRERHS